MLGWRHCSPFETPSNVAWRPRGHRKRMCMKRSTNRRSRSGGQQARPGDVESPDEAQLRRASCRRSSRSGVSSWGTTSPSCVTPERKSSRPRCPRTSTCCFITAFTNAAQLSVAISIRHRTYGTVTAVGGPHARCYPEDAARYFDYVPRLHRQGPGGRGRARLRSPPSGGPDPLLQQAAAAATWRARAVGSSSSRRSPKRRRSRSCR